MGELLESPKETDVPELYFLGPMIFSHFDVLVVSSGK